MPELDQLAFDLGLLLIAFLVAFPIGGVARGRNRSAGLRTFPIVAVACCAFMLIAQRAFPAEPNAQARVRDGIITGMGFIGGARS